MSEQPLSRVSSWTVQDEIDRLAVDADTIPDSRFFNQAVRGDDRASVLRSVFFDSEDRWISAFYVMLVLSGLVATLGLSQDSAATVIGAMIIAPLGAPIAGLGGAIALAWPRQTLRMLGVTLSGAFLVIASAALLGNLLPDGTPTAQELARTNPDLRDLGVAVLAGAAGAYARTRAWLSSALVGVAIAVALVPPLAAVGLLLEEGYLRLALGALLLFGTNFVGITLAVAVTLLLTRYVPTPHLKKASVGIVSGFIGVGLAAAALMVPLGIAYSRAMTSAQTHSDVISQVSATLGVNSSVNLKSVKVNGTDVTIRVSDPSAAPAAEVFARDLADELGPDVKVTVDQG